MSEVKGKVAIVTGGGSGIGYEFVKILQAKGCNVVIGDLALTPNAKLLLEDKSSGKVVFKQTDVTKWDQLAEMFAFTEKEFGPPDIVCPGAGIFEPVWSSFWHDKEEESYKMIQINIEHPTKATRLAIRSFLKNKKKGVVLHISSIGAQSLRAEVPVYCATKAYISHLIRCLAPLDQAEGIRVVGVAPGIVRTPLWHKENPERTAKLGDEVKWIEPVEIAEVMYELCVNAAYKGGSVVEAAGKGETRLVELFNDPGPGGAYPANAINDEVAGFLGREKSNL